MSSLADRLAAASRDRATPTDHAPDAMATMTRAPRQDRRPRPRTTSRHLKSQVHNTLLQQLGPKLYDAELTQTELEHMVKGALQEAMQAEDILLDHRRADPDLPGDRRRHPRLRPDRAVPARPRPHRGHGQRPGQHLHRARRPAGQGRGPLHRRGAPAPHDRQDRVPHRPPRRRVEPDGGRPPPRRQPRQRGHPAAGRGRLAADHPEVLRRPVHLRRPGRVRHLLAAHRRLPGRLRQGPAEHHRLRQHRLRQDHDPQRALVVHPDRRAHRHHRGRRRAPAAPGPRAPAGVAARRTSRARARSTSATW